MTIAPFTGRRIRWHVPLLALILIAGFVLRVYNIRWDEGKLTHPDERSTVAFYAPIIRWPKDLSTALDPRESTLNPLWDRSADHRRSYTYGHFPLYLLTASADLASRTAPLWDKLGASPETVNFVRLLKGVPGYAFVGRFLMGVADTFTVYLVYLIARKLYGKGAGLLAAAFSAFTVTQIQLAHFFAVDPISATFTLLAIYGAMLMVERRTAGAAVVTGVGAGLAVASKFSALPILAAPVVATLLIMFRRGDQAQESGEGDRSRSQPLTYLLLALVVAFLVFAVTSPFVFLDWDNWVQAVIKEQGAMVRGEADFPFTRQYRGTLPYVYFFEQQLKWGMGWPLGIVTLAGLAWTLVRGIMGRLKGGEWITLSWIVPYFGLTGLFLAKFMRYMAPVVPLLCVYGAGMLWAWWRRWRRPRSAPEGETDPDPESTGRRWPWRRARRILPIALMVVAVAGGALWALAFVNGVYRYPHTWIAASRWIYANVPDGSVLASEHWDDDLPLGLPEPGADQGAHGYRIVDLPLYEEDNRGKYELIRSRLQEADYVVLS
ncbi:MAG TPA: glycosyltransferase family 39 protein, partial [Anaerolineae bacterium]|nr:glycosyltransferase family 39 protein [Anaerolineae bacterium]